MIHNTHADSCLLFTNTFTYLDYHATGLVSADDRIAGTWQAEGRCAADNAVEFEIAAAHAGSLDFEYCFSGPGCWIRHIANFDFAITEKVDSAHWRFLVFQVRGSVAWFRSVVWLLLYSSFDLLF
jgi:hypothetical protein